MIDAKEEKAIGQALIVNADLFTWTTIDLPRVYPMRASHSLSIFKGAKLISQKKRKLDEKQERIPR